MDIFSQLNILKSGINFFWILTVTWTILIIILGLFRKEIHKKLSTIVIIGVCGLLLLIICSTIINVISMQSVYQGFSQ
jgi:hypothetical protein